MANNFLRHMKYSFLPFSVSNLLGADKLVNATPTEQKTDKSKVEEKTGWDRLKLMFSVDEFGNISYELNSILHVATMSLFVGCVYGGIMNSRYSYDDFVKNNQATVFNNHFEAKRKLQDKVTLSFAKGAFRWGWRITLFSSTFVCISTMIQVYREKYGVREYVIAGGLTGFMYKFNMGPRAWLVGGGLGSFLGLMCGVTTIGILKMAGISIEEARFWQSQWKTNRIEYVRKGLEDYLEKQDYAVIRIHDDIVGKEGHDIKNLDTNVNNKEE